MAVLRHLIPGSAGQIGGGGAIWFPARDIPTESLIVGALEAAFWEMVRIEAIANNLWAPHTFAGLTGPPLDLFLGQTNHNRLCLLNL